MGKRLKNYLACIQQQVGRELQPEVKEDLLKDLLIQISFFQHERLIHLIVTAVFALLTVAAIFTSFFYQTLGLYLLILLFLALLVPYIRHYYLLENGVQKLYECYDKLKK